MKQSIINFLSKIVFAIGIFAVAVFTRLRDLFLPKKEVMAMTHCIYHDYPWPTPTQAMNAGAGLAQMAFNADLRDAECIADCATTVIRFGASKVFPGDDHVHEMASSEDVESLKSQGEEAVWERLGQELEPCLPKKYDKEKDSADQEATKMKKADPKTVGAFNWSLIIQLAQMLLDLWKNRQVG